MDLETVNIPAYQRKRSLAAKSRSTRLTAKRITPTPTRKKLSTPIIRKRPITSRPRPESQFTHTIPLTNTITNEVREMKICGICEGYFDNIDVAIIKVTSPIRTGDSLIFEKENGLFEQPIKSMQINRKDVSLARSGSDIGIKVEMIPTVGTQVYKVI